MKTLAAWLGNTDVNGAKNGSGPLSGPIGQALSAESYDRLLLLSNQPDSDLSKYEEWLRSWSEIEVVSKTVPLSDPTDFRKIYLAATEFLDANVPSTDSSASLVFHLSPGTPAMAAIWLLLATTRYAARMIQSSAECSVKEAEVPFEISIEYVPRVVETADRKLRKEIAEVPPEGAAFGDIYYRSATMANVIELAKRAAIAVITSRRYA